MTEKKKERKKEKRLWEEEKIANNRLVQALYLGLEDIK